MTLSLALGTAEASNKPFRESNKHPSSSIPQVKRGSVSPKARPQDRVWRDCSNWSFISSASSHQLCWEIFPSSTGSRLAVVHARRAFLACLSARRQCPRTKPNITEVLIYMPAAETCHHLAYRDA